MSEAIERLSAYTPLEGPALGYVLLDVFAEAALAGNQLAVFTDGRSLEPAAMQRLARELNLSESVFVLPPEGGGDARVRIFTPAVELPFAGHPVLGAGVLLALALGREEVTIETGSGPVPVQAGGGTRRIDGRMAQPLPTWTRYERAEELLEGLGAASSGLPVEIYKNGPQHVYVALEDEQALAALRPDMRAVASHPATVSCFTGANGRFTVRVFAPALGVEEDPATGSAAGPLAVHLCRHGRAHFGEEIEIAQGAEVGRPSRLRALARGSAREIEAVEVAGGVVIVGRGELVSGARQSKR